MLFHILKAHQKLHIFWIWRPSSSDLLEEHAAVNTVHATNPNLNNFFCKDLFFIALPPIFIYNTAYKAIIIVCNRFVNIKYIKYCY